MNRTNDEKLELFADLMEPAGAIIGDRAWAEKWQAGDRAGAIKAAIKRHKPEIVEILARIDGVDPERYTIDGVALFMRLAELLNRPDMEATGLLFTQQAQSAAAGYSGPVTESIAGAGT